jgi:DNA (cytosine-5)-methyltransferase 1
MNGAVEHDTVVLPSKYSRLSKRRCAYKSFYASLPYSYGGGIHGDNTSHYWLEEDGVSCMLEQGIVKPPYRVPLMTEIVNIPWNGLSVVSTFSGTGGSCLGNRMAGFRVLWANEFVPAAQASYKANAARGSLLDGRDIRQVRPEEILQAIGLQAGELDVLEGSPPCQAFSMAGKRAKGWGKDKQYEHGARQKNETLFTEYIRILKGLQPKVFVAENVSGLVKGVAKGYFKEILRDLKACGYCVEARLLDAQWLGVPQMRQRIIFQGVRIDLEKRPAWPKPLPYRYSVRDALPSINDMIHDTGGYVRNKTVTDGQGPSVTVGMNALNSSHYLVAWDEGGAWNHNEITALPSPTIRSGRAGTIFIEGANGFNGHAGSSVDSPALTIQAGRAVKNLDGTSHYLVAPSTRGGHGFHAQDVMPDLPCPTVTTASPGNDCPVPSRLGRRKLTIAELKRICAFPDDFILTGSYAQQWERLGNSVPPIMMYHLAVAIRDGLLDPLALRPSSV